jgi:hypothetical protein
MQFPATPNLEESTFKHDLVLEVNGEKFKGVGVIKRASQYKIKIYPNERIDRVFWHTCHQEDTVDKPDTGWFTKSYEFYLNDVPGVQDVHACALDIVSMDQQSRRNGFATLEFLDMRPEISLPALVKCNGMATFYDKGVSICQSAEGLIEQIKFNEPVVQTGAKPDCDVMKALDDKTFTFIMPKGKCTYYFTSDRKIGGKRVSHRLQTVGYTNVPPK